MHICKMLSMLWSDKSKTEKNCDWGQHIEFDDDCDKTSLFIMVWTQASKCKMKLL